MTKQKQMSSNKDLIEAAREFCKNNILNSSNFDRMMPYQFNLMAAFAAEQIKAERVRLIAEIREQIAMNANSERAVNSVELYLLRLEELSK